MTLPSNTSLKTNKLMQVYDNTVATYKYYWLVSILDIYVKEGKTQISFWEIIVGMIAEAWYPIHFFRLSFGKADSLYAQIFELQKELNIPIDARKQVIKRVLNSNVDTPKIRSLLRVFSLNVPYRFLSPWIKYTTNEGVVRSSQVFTNNALYAIENDTIRINPKWETYLHDNYLILRDFTFWHLTNFLQKRNPNVPNLTSKLVKPISRASLTRQRQFWDTFIEVNGTIKCIYTGQLLEPKNYDLDHFIPWSFVSHDLLWNLVPADAGINSSKSNNLPILEEYLSPYAQIHQNALRVIFKKNPNNNLLEDYLTIHDSIPNLIKLSALEFFEIFHKTFSPMTQIAENMGFRYWQNPMSHETTSQ